MTHLTSLLAAVVAAGLLAGCATSQNSGRKSLPGEAEASVTLSAPSLRLDVISRERWDYDGEPGKYGELTQWSAADGSSATMVLKHLPRRGKVIFSRSLLDPLADRIKVWTSGPPDLLDPAERTMRNSIGVASFQRYRQPGEVCVAVRQYTGRERRSDDALGTVEIEGGYCTPKLTTRKLRAFIKGLAFVAKPNAAT